MDPSSIDAIFASVAGVPATKRGKSQRDTPTAHNGQVTGVTVDALNARTITVGVDGYMRVWDFGTHALFTEVNVGVPITQLEVAKDSGLVALLCDDFAVRLYDMSSYRCVRTFTGHSNRVNDVVSG